MLLFECWFFFVGFLYSTFCLVFILQSAVDMNLYAVVVFTSKFRWLQLTNMNNFNFINDFGTTELWTRFFCVL